MYKSSGASRNSSLWLPTARFGAGNVARERRGQSAQLRAFDVHGQLVSSVVSYGF